MSGVCPRFVILMLALTACASLPARKPGASEDDAAVRVARIAQNRAIAVHDLGAVEQYWTEDVTVRRALGIAMSGRAEARKAFELTGPPDSAVVYQRTTTGVEISAAWPLAFETGRWTGQLRDTNGPVVIKGNYSAQWVKREGRWLIRAEVFVPLDCAGVGCGYRAAP